MACNTASLLTMLVCAKRRAPAATDTRKEANMWGGFMAFGEVVLIGINRFKVSAKSIL
jgi:hypothetical protein